MADAKREDLTYEPGHRYIIEIKKTRTKELFHTSKIRALPCAKEIAGHYNTCKGLAAVILDTKTGEEISGQQLC